MPLFAVDYDPEPRKLQQFGFVTALVLAVFGTWILFDRRVLPGDFSEPGARVASVVLWLAAGLGLLLGRWAPRALRPLWVMMTAVTRPIGLVMSIAVLAVVFYGLFTPIALLFRVIGRDALRRRFAPESRSYWIRRRPVTDVERYLRQY